jgi:hypothetical protein
MSKKDLNGLAIDFVNAGRELIRAYLAPPLDPNSDVDVEYVRGRLTDMIDQLIDNAFCDWQQT